jgi:ribosomal protein S12 methylthiotransferase accessory factor YcaO
VFWAHNFFLSSFIVLAASTSRDIETPFILHLIRQVYPKLDFSVQFVKVPSEGDVAVFLVVKSGEDKPFLEVKVPRLPKIGSSVVVREL